MHMNSSQGSICTEQERGSCKSYGVVVSEKKLPHEKSNGPTWNLGSVT